MPDPIGAKLRGAYIPRDSKGKRSSSKRSNKRKSRRGGRS